MKKITILFIALLGFTMMAQAQPSSQNAIGLRVGDNDGLGTELSYQRALGDINRLEVDLGWRSSNSVDAIKLIGLYQWVFLLDGNFNWYVGAGGGIAQFSFDNNVFGNIDSETFLVAAGDIGVEYDFDFPLILSLDFRPEIGFGDFNDDFDFDLGLGIRYQF